MKNPARTVLALIFTSILAAGPASAQERETPYWASIDTSQLNMRVGPGRDYRIEWVYERDDLPLSCAFRRAGGSCRIPTGRKAGLPPH